MPQKGCFQMMSVHILLVGIGGFLGAMSRYGINEAIKRIKFIHFPLATLVVNLLGSFLLGIIVGKQLHDIWFVLLGFGFLAAFTTFSTFTLDVLLLLRARERMRATIYILLTYGLAICAACLGIKIGIIL